jgi:hypothetical protein
MTDAAVTSAEPLGTQSRRAANTYTWGALGPSQNGAPVQRPGEKATIVLVGTFGGTVIMQGSEDGTNWYPLKDFLGNAITATTTLAAFVVTVLPAYVRPSAGVGVSAVVASMTVTNV